MDLGLAYSSGFKVKSKEPLRTQGNDSTKESTVYPKPDWELDDCLRFSVHRAVGVRMLAHNRPELLTKGKFRPKYPAV